jgi:hypothetical protein
MNAYSCLLARFSLVCAIVAITSLATGCAEVSIYKDPDLSPQSRTGVPFFAPKPYLLVSKTGAKDKPVEVTVIYIPDTAKPLYARLSPGLWGASDLSVQFSNGVITSVGQKADTKLPEVLTSLGGLQTALANAAKTREEARKLANESATDLTPQAEKLRTVKKGMDAQLAIAQKQNFLTSIEMDVLKSVSAALETVANNLADPTKAQTTLNASVSMLTMSAKNWDGQIKDPSPTPRGTEADVRRQLTTLRGQLQAVIDDISPKPEPAPVFNLYEIDTTSGSTVLKEVRF